MVPQQLQGYVVSDELKGWPCKIGTNGEEMVMVYFKELYSNSEEMRKIRKRNWV
jgi:hypothetical protein